MTNVWHGTTRTNRTTHGGEQSQIVRVTYSRLWLTLEAGSQIWDVIYTLTALEIVDFTR